MTAIRDRLLAILKEPIVMFRDRYTLGVIAGATGYAFIDDVATGRDFTAAIMLTICVAAAVQSALCDLADRHWGRQ